jgi:predicted permease
MTDPDLKRLVELPRTPRRLVAEVDDELRFHLEERIDQYVAAGMTRAEAQAEVQRRFGDLSRHRQHTLAMDAAHWRRTRVRETLLALVDETGRAFRTLGRQRTFATIAVATLAIGIAATTAIFAVLDAVVLRPLPYAEPDRLVSVLHPATVPGSGERTWGMSPGGYFHIANRTRTLERMGLYVVGGTTVTGDGDAEVVDVAVTTATVFEVLRARAHAGRLYDARDDQPDSSRVAVLGYAFWQRRFGEDPQVIGRMLETSEGRYEIIGVAQPGLTLPIPGPFSGVASLNGVDLDVWIPLKLNPAGPFWNNHPYVGVARLAPGRSTAQAQAELTTLTREFPQAISNAYSESFMREYNFRVQTRALRDTVLGPSLPRTLWTLFAAVLLILAVAGANVANLFLLRFEARQRETAVRSALGAMRRHLMVHYAAESVTVAAAAGAAGLALAWLALKGVLAVAPTDTARLSDVHLDGRSFAFTAALSALVAAIFAVLPLLRQRIDLKVLRDEGRSSTTSRVRRRSRDLLVVAQLALALVLMTGATLLVRTMQQLRAVQPGFDTASTLAFDLSLPFTQYDTREKAMAFHRELEARVRALPGVVAVGSATSAPLESGFGTGCSVVWRAGRPYAAGVEPPCVATPIAMPGYLETLRVRTRGHIPGWSDVDGLTQGVVVTDALAQRLWPGEDPLGQGINSNGSDSRGWYRVVGVIPALHAEALDRPPTEAVFYAPTGFSPNSRSGALNDLTWLVRTGGSDPFALVPAIREAVSALDPRVPVVRPRTMDQVKARSLARTSFSLVMLGLAASVALVLSLVGTYGVVSYVVAQRRGEFGVRVALGATGRALSRSVVSESVRLALIGSVVGGGLSVAVNRVLRSWLFGVSPHDPLSLVSAVVVLIGCAALASIGPARRAARADPGQALRGT